MWCMSSFRIGLLGSLSIFGMVFGGILAKVLADKFGRLWTSYAGIILTFGTLAAINFIPNMTVRLIGMFFLGVFRFYVFVVYMLLMELCPQHLTSIITGVTFMYDVLTNIILPSVYFWVIDKRWKPLFWGHWLIVGVIIIVLYVFLQESPKWLYENRRYKKLRRVMAHIAWVNGKTLGDYELESEQYLPEDVKEDISVW